MAEYLINATDLTKVASAIREKGGTSASLVYPGGFVSAIQAIQTGAPLQIIVTTSAGATVTATKDSKTVSGTADTNGKCILTVTEAGTWTVTAATASSTNTADVVVGTANVDMIMIDPVFGNNSWATIIKACQEKQVPETWKVGDSCNMAINNKTYAIDIIGKDHDYYADSSGKVPLTFQIHDCYEQKVMNSSATNGTGWKNCAMRLQHLPAILALMPTEVQNGIREVYKTTAASGQDGGTPGTADKLFLLSEIEVFGGTPHSYPGEGTQYAYYKAGNSRVKKQDGGMSHWWERSPNKGTNRIFNMVNSLGNANYSDADYPCGVAFGFCF